MVKRTQIHVQLTLLSDMCSRCQYYSMHGNILSGGLLVINLAFKSLKVNGSKEVWVTVGNYWNGLKWILGLTLNGSNDIHLNYGSEEMEAQLREMLKLNGHVESVMKLQGLDIDIIQHHYTVLPEAAPLRRTEPDEARPISYEFQIEVVRKASKKVLFYDEMDINTFMKLFDEKSVAKRLRDVTGNSKNVAVLQSISDRYGHSVSRGINQKPDRNNTASRADDSRKHQDIQIGLLLFEGEQRCTDILNPNDCNLQDCGGCEKTNGECIDKLQKNNIDLNGIFVMAFFWA
ncbi:hypothetical protein Tco_0039371 [Tanacetum coccineum]